MKKTLFILFISLSTACGNEMESISVSENAKDCLNCNEIAPPVSEAPQLPIDELDGSVSSPLFKNAQVFKIDTLNREVILMLPLPIPYIVAIPDQPIPEIPGAYYRLAPSSNNLSTLEVHIPFAYFAPNVEGHVADRLPNGDPLPAVPGGELPGYGVKVESGREFYLYLGPSIAAIYLPTPEFNPYLQLTFPIKNKAKTKTLGYLATVPEKRGFDGGIYMAIQLPKELARFLDSILP